MSDKGPEKPRRKVAVVGSGVAGLTTAYLLNREGDTDVHLFEREADIGIDSQSVQVGGSRVDVPLRVFSRSFYPNLVALYDELGVQYKDADYSFCTLLWRTPASAHRDQLFFRYFQAGALSLPSLAAICSGGTNFLKLLFELGSLLATASATRPKPGETVDEHLTARGFSEEFKARLLYPMFAIVCTCSYDSVASYPAEVAFGYWGKHGLFNWPWNRTCQCRVLGGIRAIAQKLSEGSHTIHLGAQVIQVSMGGKAEGRITVNNQGKQEEVLVEGAPPSADPSVTFQRAGSNELTTETFDAVVMATQAHHALRLLGQPTAEHRQALGAFVYEPSRVVVHRDTRLMPTDPALWSPLNILVDPDSDTKMPMCSVWMHRIDPNIDPGVFQSWNPLAEPRPDTVLANSFFERPVVNEQSKAAMNQLAALQGRGGIFFVGAYALYAVPLLENGVRSAMRVAASLGADTRWRDRPAHAAGPAGSPKQAASSASSPSRWVALAAAVAAGVLIATRVSQQRAR